MLLTTISRRLRHRRAEADQVWREATRTQTAEHLAAVERILARRPPLTCTEAVEATPDRRDKQPAQRPDDPNASHQRWRRVWVDTGSGPGYEVLVPSED